MKKRAIYTCRIKTEIQKTYVTMKIIVIYTLLLFDTSSAVIYEPRHDKTNNVAVRPAKTQISLGIRPVWSESSMCAQWVAKDPSFLRVDSEDSDQTGWMPRLLWVFAGRTVTLLVLSCRGSFTIRSLWLLDISNLIRIRIRWWLR